MMPADTRSYSPVYKAANLSSFFLLGTTRRDGCYSSPHFAEMNEAEVSPGQLPPGSQRPELELRALER